MLLGLFGLFSACAPSTAVCDLPPPTAFVGEVARQTVTPSGASLPNFYVLENGHTYLVTTDARTNLLSADGARLDGGALTPGARVWVQGVLLDGHVQADEVRVLGD